MFNYIENEAEPDIDRVSQKSWVIFFEYILHYLLVRTDSLAGYTLLKCRRSTYIMKAKRNMCIKHTNLLEKWCVLPLGHSACVKKKSACIYFYLKYTLYRQATSEISEIDI